MALTIENGTIVDGADSYVTRANFITYAANRGVIIDESEDTDELLRKAFDYIDSLEPRLKGYRQNYSYANAYPRKSLIIDGYTWDSDEIPRQVLYAQYELALDLNAGIDIYNRQSSGSAPVKRVRIEGVVEKEYAVDDGSQPLRRSRSRYLLSKLMVNNGLGVVVSLG